MTTVSLFLDPQEGMSFELLRATTLRAEQLGFAGMYRSDHLTSTAGHFERAATEAWSTLAGLARETTTLRLGTLVTPIGFRHPSLYAKIINTIDEMSGGRVDVSVGTGWYKPEHELLGLPFAALKKRYDELEEYLAAMFELWGAKTTPSTPSPYGIGDITISPPSIQRPRPHVIIGGHGTQRTPALAARFGDEHNVDWLSPEATAVCYGASRVACETVGRDPASLARSILTGAIVAERADQVPERLEKAIQYLGIDNPSHWLQQNKQAWFVGTIDQLLDRLRAFTAIGTDHVVLMLAPGDDMETLSLVADRVLTALTGL